VAKRKFVALFGAGASVDAGLPSAFQLTEDIYSQLKKSKSEQSILFGIVVAKLIARNAKQGKSPFAQINVEDVYDGLKRLLNKDDDLLSEFVYSWDPISTAPSRSFDANKLAQSLASIYKLSDRRSLDGRPTLQLDNRSIQTAVSEIQRAVEGDIHQLRGASLEPFLETLSNLLKIDETKIGYMQQFLAQHSSNFNCIATLNYDQLIETALDKNGSRFDLGLSQWNEKRYVQFHGKSPKIIKLHGSTDWYIRNHDEIVTEQNPLGLSKRAMIFGGQSEKLVPDGPFLHLRHEFQRFLRGSSYLLVVGYSFQDMHLNAIIRSWIATRKNGKIIIVNPSEFSGDQSVFQYAALSRSLQGTGKLRVEIKEIRKGFAESLDQIEEALNTNPNLKMS